MGEKRKIVLIWVFMLKLIIYSKNLMKKIYLMGLQRLHWHENGMFEKHSFMLLLEESILSTFAKLFTVNILIQKFLETLQFLNMFCCSELCEKPETEKVLQVGTKLKSLYKTLLPTFASKGSDVVL